MGLSVLSAAALSTLATAPARAATITVSSQSQFDAAIAVATQSGHADTIDASAVTIDAGTSLTLPGAATSVNLQFGNFAIGASGTGDETVTLGAGTTVNFGQVSPGTLNMGSGNTGTLNINGASLIFNVTTQPGNQFNIGLDGGNGIVNMTSGAVTINDSAATPGVFGSISIGFPFTTTTNATFNQSGGIVSVSAGALNVGVANGNGTYNLSGTAVLQDRGATVYIGASAGGVCVVNISGNASIDLEAIGSAGQLYVGDNTGVGTITQNGANTSVTLNIINIAQFGSNASSLPGGGGTGTYNLFAGGLEIGGLGAAFGMDAGGVGIFNQSGGNLTANAPIYIGMSGNGTYNLSGGTATLNAGLTIAALAGSVGTVNQTGGELTIAGGRLTVGIAGTATYNLNGGVLQVGGINGITGTGSLNLGGGALQIIGSALTTNIAVGLTGTNSVVDTNGFGATFSGVMSGTGGFVKSGLGTLSLTGTNLYTGRTLISGGTLQIGTGGTTGSILGDVMDNGALVFNRSNASVFTGAISGTGALTKMGAGVLRLSGADTYGGATIINAGTLQAGSGSALSQNSAFTVASGATLDLNNFSSTIGSFAGNGSIALGTATLTTGGDAASTTFSGGIGGAGGLTKTGGGVLTLTGVSNYTGPTNVNAGGLNVNGSLVSTVTVNAGGTLMGNGSIGGLNMANGGIVAPGNSIGTLNVAGNASFVTGSIYQVETNAAGQADKIAATGTTTLSGGTVQVLAQMGGYAPQTTYTILTSTAGVTGTFSNVTSNLVFLTPTLSYDANDVFLTLNRNATFFASEARTPNQFTVAVALDAAAPASTLALAIDTQTAPGARQAFDALSGEVHASVATALVDDSVFMREAVLGRLRQVSFGGAPGPMAALGLGGPVLAYAEPMADASKIPFPIKMAASGIAPAPDLTWWSQGTSAWGRIGGDGNAASVRRDLVGYLTGVDRRFGDNWLAGIAGGYTNSNVGLSARASSANIDTVHFAAYATANYGAFNLRSGAAGSWSSIETARSVLFPGFAENATASSGAGLGQVFGEVGYATAFGIAAVEPFAGFAYVHLNTNGFTESGQSAALTGSSMTENIGYSSLGLRLATRFALDNGMALAPHASAYWQHAFGDLTPTASLAFISTGTSFTTAGIPITRDAAVIDSGLDLALTSNAKIGVSYFGQLSARLQDNAVKANFIWRF